MGVFSPERTRRAPERPPSAPPQPEPPRRGFPWGLVVVLVLFALLLGGAWAVDRITGLFPSFDNPFASEPVDRSGPAVLRSIQDIGELRAATGNYQVIVDLERDTGLPDELLGERTLYVAQGSVDAGVDLRLVGAEDVEVSDDRRSAAITLPPVRLFEPRLNLAESYVYDRREGLFNRLGGLFGDDSGYEREVNLLAEEKLREAARGGSGLAPRAEENTRELLESLLGSLGFTQVEIAFAER